MIAMHGQPHSSSHLVKTPPQLSVMVSGADDSSYLNLGQQQSLKTKTKCKALLPDTEPYSRVWLSRCSLPQRETLPLSFKALTVAYRKPLYEVTLSRQLDDKGLVSEDKW